MIKVDERERIRRAYYIEQQSIRQIAREMHHARATVRKAIASAEPETYTVQKPRHAPVLGPYRALIDELLEENGRLPRKQRRTSHQIYKAIVAESYQGSESSVRRYIAGRRRETKKRQVYIPLEFDPGEYAQVDWGEAAVILGGERVTVQLFLMRLCYSRRLFMMAFPTQKQEAFFEGHVQALSTISPALGALPRPYRLGQKMRPDASGCGTFLSNNSTHMSSSLPLPFVSCALLTISISSSLVMSATRSGRGRAACSANSSRLQASQ